MKKTILFVIAISFLISGCEKSIAHQEEKLSCTQLQEKITELNSEYGTWGKVPRDTRYKFENLVKESNCRVTGTKPWVDETFKFTVKN